MAILPIGFTLLSAFLHAGWNFLARESRETDFLLHSGLLICGFGLIPATIFEIIGIPLTPETSYVVALRQFSIVIGVLIAAILLQEAVPKLRIIAATIITSSVVIITLAG